MTAFWLLYFATAAAAFWLNPPLALVMLASAPLALLERRRWRG